MSTRSAESEVRLSFSATIKNTLDDGQVAQVTLGDDNLVSIKLHSGVDADQANRAWARTGHTLTSGNTEDIDLYDFSDIDIGAGLGNDGLGLPMALEEVVTFCIKQTSGAGRLELMPTNPANYCTWVPTMTVALGSALKTGGAFLLHQPDEDALDVEDGSSHMMRVGANGGDIVYDLYLIGRHDDEASSSSSSSTSSSSSSSTSSCSTSTPSSQSTSSTSSSSSSTSSSSSSSSSCTSSSSTAARTTSSSSSSSCSSTT